MSLLDLAQHDQEAADSWVRTHSEARLPAGPSEAFGAAWSENQLFGQSTAHSAAREKAFANYADELKARGVPYQEPQGRFIQDQYNPPDLDQKMQAAQEAATKAGIEPIDDAELDRRAIQLSREARAGYSAMAAREKGPGGGVGFLTGGLAGAATDPINLAALPVAPAEGLPLLAYALRWGAIAGTSQAAIEIAGAPYRETVQPGYLESGEPVANVVGGFAGGAATGGAIRTLGRLWTRAKTGAWPTSVRDAGNLAESEANIQATNVYPGAAGEAAHRDGLATAIDQVVKGEPVDVSEHVTPEVAAAGEQRLAPIMDARAQAIGAAEAAKAERAAAVGEPAPELPFEATAKQAASEAAVARVADHVQQISQGDAPGFDVYHGSPHDFERFDISKIGTGEGAQAYGHGLYFAENTETAKAYAETTNRFTIEGKPIDQANPSHVAALSVDQYGEGAPAALSARLDQFRSGLENARKYAPKEVPNFETEIKTIEQAKKLVESGAELPQIEKNANLYRVRINADPEHFLDWDKPLSEQSAHVRKALEPLLREFGDKNTAVGEYLYRYLGRQEPVGEAGYKILQPADEAKAAAILREAGIPGIKYLDQGSRDAGEGSRNFALFDDKLASITEKNGLPVMPREDAEKLAKLIVKADEPQAQAIVQAIQDRPQTVADFPPTKPTGPPPPEINGALPPEAAAKMLGSPEHEAAIRADIDRARMTGDVKIPAGIDEKGEPVYRSLDSAMNEVDALKEAADHIQACVNPPAEPANG